MGTHVRSSLRGDFRHPHDCIEVQGDSLREVLCALAEEVARVEDSANGTIISVDVGEEYEPHYMVTGRLWLADASRLPDRELLTIDQMISRLEAAGGDAHKVATLEQRLADLEQRMAG